MLRCGKQSNFEGWRGLVGSEDRTPARRDIYLDLSWQRSTARQLEAAMNGHSDEIYTVHSKSIRKLGS